MTREQIEKLIDDIDNCARDYDAYEMGLSRIGTEREKYYKLVESFILDRERKARRETAEEILKAGDFILHLEPKLIKCQEIIKENSFDTANTEATNG